MLVVTDPGPFRLVVADDPARACFQHLRALSSFRNIAALIRERHPEQADLGDSELQRLNLWLNHAIDFLHTAAAAESSSRHLTSYYGVLNLSRFIVSIENGCPVAEDHHGLSRSRESTQHLSEYTACASRPGALHALARCCAITVPPKAAIKLVDILLSDRSSALLASSALSVPPRCVSGSIDIAKYKSVVQENANIKERRKEYAPGHYSLPDGSGGSLRAVEVMLRPSSRLEVQRVQVEWAAYVRPDTVLEFRHPMPGIVLAIPDGSLSEIDLAFEIDGAGQNSASTKLPGAESWWPALLRQFAGAWMLADVVRYTPEMLVHRTGGKDDEIQIACDLFTDTVTRGFPLLCLQHLTREQIRFAPQWFIP